MSKVQTDNSFLYDKIKLRIDNLPNKESINVLNCFAGENKIWNKIKEYTNKNINLTNIDVKEKKDKFYLQGKNEKFIDSLDLDKYDIIDLDAYGIPFEQLEIIFKKKYKGILFITYIQSGMGRLPKKLLLSYGYNNNMIKKCYILLCKNGFNKIKTYLSKNGITKIKYKESDRKYYISIATT